MASELVETDNFIFQDLIEKLSIEQITSFLRTLNRPIPKHDVKGKKTVSEA